MVTTPFILIHHIYIRIRRVTSNNQHRKKEWILIKWGHFIQQMTSWPYWKTNTGYIEKGTVLAKQPDSNLLHPLAGINAVKAVKIETWFINCVGAFDNQLWYLCSLWWPRIICTAATWWRVSVHSLLTTCCLICYRWYFNNSEEARNRQEKASHLSELQSTLPKNQQVMWDKKIRKL